MIKKKLSLILFVMMTLTLFAACSSNNSSSNTSNTTAPPSTTTTSSSATTTQTASDTTATSDKPVEISCVLNLNPEIVLDNNPVIQQIEKKLNIKLNIEAPPQNGYGDRVKMLVATGDMPDLVHYGADISATQWAQEGLIMDVTDVISKYPNLSKNISKEQYGDCVFLPDGRIYGIPKPNSYDKWGFLINKKWLDKLGLKAPTTVDEFVTVCRAFTNDDPDGNSKNDTFGASLNAQQSSMDSGIWHLMNDFLSTAYGISSWHAGLPDVDGSAKLRPLKSEYGEYIQLIHSLYAEGIIDREFVTFNGSEAQDAFAQQRVGIIGVSETNYITNILEKYSLNIDDYVYCPPLVKTADQKPVYACPPSNWMAYYVNAKSSPEKQDAALRLLDYANSEEGFVLLQMGIAGSNYNSYDVETRTVDRTPEQQAARMKVTSNMLAMANALDGKSALQGGSTPEAIAKWQKEAGAAEKATQKCYFGFTKMLDKIGVEFPDEIQTLNSLEVRYVTGEVQYDDLMNYINGTYKEKTAAIAKEFEDYMAANPARYVD